MRLAIGLSIAALILAMVATGGITARAGSPLGRDEMNHVCGGCKQYCFRADCGPETQCNRQSTCILDSDCTDRFEPENIVQCDGEQSGNFYCWADENYCGVEKECVCNYVGAPPYYCAEGDDKVSDIEDDDYTFKFCYDGVCPECEWVYCLPWPDCKQ